MQPVRQLDYDDSYILAHGKEDFSYILRLLLIFGEYLHLTQLCNTVDQHGNINAEKLMQLLQCTVSILNHIVQKCRTDSIGIHAQLKEYISYCQRMRYIRLA